MAPADAVPLLGFVVACAFGALAHRTGFCTMGAFSDAVTFGDLRRLRMFVLAIAVAIVGAQALHLAGLADLSQSIYTSPRFLWLAHVVGGLLFGIGMTLASGCGARNLVRLGAGNLKSLLVLLVMAVTAYATLKGLLAPVRVNGLETLSITFASGQDFPALVGSADVRPWIVAAVVVPLLAWCFAAKDFRESRALGFGAVAIGALVAAGWYVTGHLGFVPEDPETLEAVFVGTNTHRPESLTFVAPLAFGLEWLTLWSDGTRHITFGIAAMAGTLTGAAADAVTTRRFRWEMFASPADLARHVVGAILMGFGGVTALGCSIGQGITGVSTLSLGAVVTLVSIATGCVLTLRSLEWTLSRTA